MGPGHRQNGGQRQEPHLDATEGHFVGRGVPSWLLLVWGVFGKSVGLGGGSVGPVRGSERRVFASEAGSRTALGGLFGADGVGSGVGKGVACAAGCAAGCAA